MRKSPTRPRRFPGCRGAAIIALVVTAFAANAAYDYYWYGAAGDGLWTTPANWSTTSDSYTKAGDYPRSSTFSVHVDTAVAPDHHVTIRIPKFASNPAGCGAFEFFDSTGAGTLTLAGEPDAETGRPSIPLGNNLKFAWTETGHPMRLELLSLNLANGSLSVVENECAGCGVLVSNCVSTTTGNNYYMKLPGQRGGTMTVVDSEITTQILNASSASDVAGYVFAVTNSTIAIKNGADVGGPGTVVDVFGSTLAFGLYAPYFGAGSVATTNEHPGMKIRFKDSTLKAGSSGWCHFLSAGGELVLDNVTQEGNFKGIGLAGLTTELIDTSLKFYSQNANGYRGISGTLRLDNSEWVATNGVCMLNGPLALEFAGRAPAFEASAFSGNYPVTLNFLVPKGGYARPPVNRMDNAATGQVFPSGAAGGAINVLPESPMAKASGTWIVPLVYVKDSKSSKPVCQLANLPLSELPNERSRFLVTTDYAWDYADVDGKAESDWTAVEPGFDGAVAGVAVKLVGRPPGTVVVVR